MADYISLAHTSIPLLYIQYTVSVTHCAQYQNVLVPWICGCIYRRSTIKWLTLTISYGIGIW